MRPAASPTPVTNFNIAALAAGAGGIAAFAATMRWAYHQYDTFHWFIFACACATGYQVRSRPLLLTVCVVAAVFFNPIVPLRMRRYNWVNTDYAVGIAFCFIAILVLRERAAAAKADLTRR